MYVPFFDCLFSLSSYFYPLLHIRLVDDFHCPIFPITHEQLHIDNEVHTMS